jgi:signal transduction histidine kinase
MKASRGAFLGLLPEFATGRLLDLLPVAAYTCDRSGLITCFNQAAVRVWGRAPALNDPADRYCGSWKLYSTDGAPLAHDRCWMARTLQEQRPYEGREIEIEQPDGRRVTALAYANPIFDADGQMVGAMSVLVDISDRRALERSLREREEELREADTRKNEFLAMLGHELRNPLGPITNAVEYLRRQGPMDAEMIRAREVIDRQVGNMARLVDDLLSVARISRGSLQLKKEIVALDDVIESAMDVARPLLEARGHELTLSLPDAPLHVHADGVRLAQVISNLLGNAAKYTEPGGHVGLAVRPVPATAGEPEGLELVVADDGNGIAAADLPLIFDMFVQVGAPSQRTGDGLGVGLTLARTILEMHGGTIEARSDGPGRGSTFIVRLPLAAAAAPQPATSADRRDAPATRRILVVDDHEDSAASLGELLALAGHEVRTALSGTAALRTAADFEPDTILLDIGLPDLDGYEVCRRLRAQPWAAGALIVAITGWGQREDKRLADEAGFSVHMTKPVQVAVLRQLLATPA